MRGCTHRALLEDFAAGRLAAEPAQRFEAHLGACGSCRDEFARVATMRALLSSYVPPQPSDLDWGRIDRKVLAALASPAARRSRLGELLPSLALGTLAAAALLAVLVRLPSPLRGPSAPARPSASALAVGLGPDALAQAPGGPPALLESTPLVGAGARLYSGAGSISLQTAPATGIHLGPESQAVLDSLAEGDTSVRLLDGLVLAEVKPLAAGQRFEVRAADLVVRVRGTSFSVERRAALTVVSAVHGMVEVGRDGEESKLLVAPAAMSVVDGAPLPEPTAIDERIGARFPLRFADAPVEAVLQGGRFARLHSRPEGAVVWVGGAFRGATPVAVLVPPGRQAIRLVAPGRPELDLDVDAALQPLQLATLPAPDAGRATAERSAPHRASGPALPSLPAAPPAALESPQREVREAMRFQVRAHMDELVRCYERAMKRDPALAGELTLTVALDAAGTVQEVSARGKKVDQGFLDCASDSIRGWALPSTGEEERFEIPLQLSRKD